MPFHRFKNFSEVFQEKIVRHKISENSLTDNGKAHAIVQIGKYIIYVIDLY